MFAAVIHTRQASPHLLHREVDATRRSRGDGQVGGAELARRARDGLWVPGRFRNALREAERAGHVRRLAARACH